MPDADACAMMKKAGFSVDLSMLLVMIK